MWQHKIRISVASPHYRLMLFLPILGMLTVNCLNWHAPLARMNNGWTRVLLGFGHVDVAGTNRIYACRLSPVTGVVGSVRVKRGLDASPQSAAPGISWALKVGSESRTSTGGFAGCVRPGTGKRAGAQAGGGNGAGNMDTAPSPNPPKRPLRTVPDCLWLFSGGKV